MCPCVSALCGPNNGSYFIKIVGSLINKHIGRAPVVSVPMFWTSYVKITCNVDIFVKQLNDIFKNKKYLFHSPHIVKKI